MKHLAILVALVALTTGIAAGDSGNELTRQKRTMARIRTIGTALEAYKIDHGSFPVVDQTTVGALRDPLSEYLRELDSLDDWGNPIHVLSSGVSFAIWSTGLDGKHDEKPAGGPQESADADIIFTQRADDHPSFWQGPPGVDGVNGLVCGVKPLELAREELQMILRLGVKATR